MINPDISVSQLQATASILLIGGTDPSGAGLQADWRVVHALGIQTYSVVTAVTAQNNRNVSDIGALQTAPVTAQLQSVQQSLQSDDSAPLAAIKIGMLGNEQVIAAVCEGILALGEQGQRPRIIVDPLIMASSGAQLLTLQGEKALIQDLLPLTDVVTPNLNELAHLTDMPVNNVEEVEAAVNQLLSTGVKSVLLKGGHFNEESGQSSDYFCSESLRFWLIGKRWPDRKNVRGTGCLFATAMACANAQGYAVADAIVLAKTLVSRGIRNAVPADGAYQARLGDINSDDWSVDYQDFPLMTLQPPETARPNLRRCDDLRLGIYPVVDSVEWVEKLINCGIKTIQLRLKTDVKNPPTWDELDKQIAASVAVCESRNIRLFINDHWQLAIKHGAYGIHLGQEDLYDADMQAIADSGCHLGVSTHSYTEVARALWVNPSYIALGPIYSTTSKTMPWIPQGPAAVKRWVNLLDGKYPLVAIGGINLVRAKELKPTGVGSVAMITAITKADDYQLATQKLIDAWAV